MGIMGILRLFEGHPVDDFLSFFAILEVILCFFNKEAAMGGGTLTTYR